MLLCSRRWQSSTCSFLQTRQARITFCTQSSMTLKGYDGPTDREWQAVFRTCHAVWNELPMEPLWLLIDSENGKKGRHFETGFPKDRTEGQKRQKHAESTPIRDKLWTINRRDGLCLIISFNEVPRGSDHEDWWIRDKCAQSQRYDSEHGLKPKHNCFFFNLCCHAIGRSCERSVRFSVRWPHRFVS